VRLGRERGRPAPRPPDRARVKALPEPGEERQAQIAALREAKYRRIGQTRMCYQAVHEQLTTGASMRAAARVLGLAYNTVRTYGQQKQPTILDAFKPHFHDCLAAGSKVKGTTLFREIRAQGYPGSYGTMARYLRELRTIGAVPVVTVTPPAPRLRLRHVDPHATAVT
jgi:hypothetical protein